MATALRSMFSSVGFPPVQLAISAAAHSSTGLLCDMVRVIAMVCFCGPPDESLQLLCPADAADATDGAVAD